MGVVTVCHVSGPAPGFSGSGDPIGAYTPLNRCLLGPPEAILTASSSTWLQGGCKCLILFMVLIKSVMSTCKYAWMLGDCGLSHYWNNGTYKLGLWVGVHL